MQSESPSGPLQTLSLPGMAWRSTRRAVPVTTLWSALLVFLLVLTIARSTVAAGWVNGIDIGPLVALSGAALMGVLAVTPLPWSWCIGFGMAMGPVVAGMAAAPAFRSLHPLDPAGWPLIQTWMARVADGSAFSDSAFVLFIIAWLMWVTGAWLSWCVLRWRQPMIGLIPGAAAFATNVLNVPADQNGYTLGFLVLTFALLLWTNYTSSVARALAARMRLTGDARWDFWESGLVATAALIVLGIMLPPLSTVDKTVTMESNFFSSWAQLQQQLNHPGALGTGSGSGGGTTGFSTSVGLGGPLTKSKNIVFTYTITGNYPGPRYFRGVNVTVTQNGQWRYSPPANFRVPIAKGTVPLYGDDYQKMALATFGVNMVVPPQGYSDILFYPGQLYHVDRPTQALEARVPAAESATTPLVTIDRLSSVNPPQSTGKYTITVEYPDVTEAVLRSVGVQYPTWLDWYMSLPDKGYRSPDVLQRIHDLAVQVTQGATNPYDQAKAIQDYLRSSEFHYTLTPPAPPPGVDPLDFFLFTSKQGYCEYFATAMGDMLRSLGIPSRLVNGYGPGSFDTAQGRYDVRGQDAHTWVEVYFPTYGWIPFEPTADGAYFPIQRSALANLCLRDSSCNTPGQLPGGGTTVSPTPGSQRGLQDIPNSIGGPGGPGVLDANAVTKIVGVLLALVLLMVALAARYLRPRTVMGVWKRTLVLARLAGAEVQPGETPLELSRRLARVFPEAAAAIRALAGGFVVAAYAPPDVAESARTSVMEAWSSLRPLMLRRVAGRFTTGRA